ncbi:MAG: PadR family transcriptional regulator [Ruminococcus sp.]|nr:PadR family transcriptional regulator [Ruminococcus sp.]MDE6538686.1 PadR family transcriptional regulator [Ruminococcus sp.]
MRVRENLKRGTVEMVLLHLLNEREMYGYEILSEMRERSGGQFAIKDGSMYPILYRMIDKGFIEDEQVLVGRRRTRVYYHITETGKAHLKELVEEYHIITKGINELLSSKSDAVSSRPIKE